MPVFINQYQAATVIKSSWCPRIFHRGNKIIVSDAEDLFFRACVYGRLGALLEASDPAFRLCP